MPFEGMSFMESIFFVLALAGPVIIIALVCHYTSSRCPQCGKLWGLKETGEIRKVVGKHGIDDEERWECMYCVHSTWRKYYRE